MIDFSEIIRQYGFNNNSATSTQLRRRIEKARQMTLNGFSLWGQLTKDTAIGVIQSQSENQKYNLHLFEWTVLMVALKMSI